MPIIPIHNVGSVGVISSRDISPYELPPEAWSSAVNIHFEDGKVKKFQGDQERFSPTSIVPYSLFPAFTSSQAYWIYAGLQQVYVTDMSSHFDITRSVGGNYNASASTKWNGGSINGIPVLNNGADAPQMWLPVTPGQRLQELGAWATFPGGAGSRAKVIRPAFRFFLVALDLTISGQSYPSDIVGSHPAEPGTVPNTWDVADPATDAVRIPVGDTPGACLDLVMLTGKTGILYKADSTYVMQYVGGGRVFDVDILFPKTGLLATNCAKPFPGGHFVVTQDDVIVHSGRNPQSVLSGRTKKLFQALIDPTYKDRSFVVQNFARHEMWFYFVEAGSGATQPNMIFVWNWDTGACSFARTTQGFGTDGCASAELGVVNASAVTQTWDSDSQVWDDDISTWDERLFDPGNTQILQAAPAASALYQADTTTSATRVAFVERLGLSLVGKDRQGNLKSDKDSIKFVKRILPRFSDTVIPVHVRVGSQDIEDGPITWSPDQLFDPTSMNELPVDVVGRFISVRFETLEGESGIWTLDSYALDIDVVGRY